MASTCVELHVNMNTWYVHNAHREPSKLPLCNQYWLRSVLDVAELGRRDGKAIDLQMVHLEVLLLVVALCSRHQLADLCVKIIHGLDTLMIA